MLAIAAFASAVSIVLLIAGPQLMQLAFGDEFTYDRVGLLCVSVGMGLYQQQRPEPGGRGSGPGPPRRGAMGDVAAGFIVFNLLPILSEFRRVEVGFLAAAAVLCALLYALYRHPVARSSDAVAPGSSAEIEARLAVQRRKPARGP